MIFDSFRGFFSASERNWTVSLRCYDGNYCLELLQWFSMNIRRKSNGFSSLEMIHLKRKEMIYATDWTFISWWLILSFIDLSLLLHDSWSVRKFELVSYVLCFFFQEFFCLCSIHWGMDPEVPPPLVDKVNMVADNPLTRFVLDDNPLSVFRQ